MAPLEELSSLLHAAAAGSVLFTLDWQNLAFIASVLQSLERASDSLGVCATRGTSSISDSLLGIEAADVALLVVRVLAAAIPSEDYWRFSDVSRGVRAAPPRAPTSERLRQGPQPHTSRCVRPRTAVRAATPPSGYLLSEVFAGVRAAPESSDEERDVRGTELLLLLGAGSCGLAVCKTLGLCRGRE